MSYVSTREELSKVYHDPTLDILSWDLVTPTMMQLRTKRKEGFVPLSRGSCAVISAWVRAQVGLAIVRKGAN